MEINITVKIDDEELKKLFGISKENEYESNSKGGEQVCVSDYARFFDDGCINWTKNADENLIFLKNKEAYCNILLKNKGYLFLNDVYDQLGIPRTKTGAIVGWVYNKEHPYGDNYVDFGIYDAKINKNRNFINGYETAILLDFNVYGNILDLI